MSNEALLIGLALVLTIITLLVLRIHLKLRSEFSQFVKSVRYRDFSRHYEVSGSLPYQKSLRKGFNLIQETFRTISKEKETQYQYLQTVLEMVDTGILAYQDETGKVMWMNDSLKELLGIPYLKTIESLSKRDPNLHDRIISLEPGERAIIALKQDQEKIKVVLSATRFLIGGISYKLVVFQNVSEALDETESMAWQKLLSVMTHEIMNSVAPISSLANTLQSRIKEIPDTPGGQISDLELGIETIKNRSEGLLRFAEVYRNLYKITGGKFELIRLSDIFGNIHRLMKPKLEQLHISVEFIMKEPLLTIRLDKGLIEQVLINLILNAIDAVKETSEPKILITAYTDNDNKPIIKVADNGSGIPPEMLDLIFIPFFSTKKNGNGIGLSLCKQIMQVHKGTIAVQSIPTQGTAVYLRF